MKFRFLKLFVLIILSTLTTLFISWIFVWFILILGGSGGMGGLEIVGWLLHFNFSIFGATIPYIPLSFFLLLGFIFVKLYKKYSKSDLSFKSILIPVLVVQALIIPLPQWASNLYDYNEYSKDPYLDGEIMLAYIEDKAILNNRISGKYGLEISDNDIIWSESVPGLSRSKDPIFHARLSEDLSIANVTKLDSTGFRTLFEGKLCFDLGYCYDFDTGEYKQIDDNEEVEKLLRSPHFLTIPGNRFLFPSWTNDRGAYIYDYVSGEIEHLGFDSSIPSFAKSYGDDNICYTLNSHDIVFGRLDFRNLELETINTIEGPNETYLDRDRQNRRGNCVIYTCSEEKILYSCQGLDLESLTFYEYKIKDDIEKIVKVIPQGRTGYENDVKLLDNYLYFPSASNVISKMEIGKYKAEEVLVADRDIYAWDTNGNVLVYLENMGVTPLDQTLIIKKLKSKDKISR